MMELYEDYLGLKKFSLQILEFGQLTTYSKIDPKIQFPNFGTPSRNCILLLFNNPFE